MLVQVLNKVFVWHLEHVGPCRTGGGLKYILCYATTLFLKSKLDSSRLLFLLFLLLSSLSFICLLFRCSNTITTTEANNDGHSSLAGHWPGITNEGHHRRPEKARQ